MLSNRRRLLRLGFGNPSRNLRQSCGSEGARAPLEWPPAPAKTLPNVRRHGHRDCDDRGCIHDARLRAAAGRGRVHAHAQPLADRPPQAMAPRPRALPEQLGPRGRPPEPNKPAPARKPRRGATHKLEPGSRDARRTRRPRSLLRLPRLPEPDRGKTSFS